MRDKHVECPKCRKEMTAGFVLARGNYELHRLIEWADGAPERSIWTGISLKRKQVLPVTTHRCTSCGFLESYATA